MLWLLSLLINTGQMRVNFGFQFKVFRKNYSELERMPGEPDQTQRKTKNMDSL